MSSITIIRSNVKHTIIRSNVKHIFIRSNVKHNHYKVNVKHVFIRSNVKHGLEPPKPYYFYKKTDIQKTEEKIKFLTWGRIFILTSN